METIKAEKPETGTPQDAGQHTPGPWDIYDNGSSLHIFAEDGSVDGVDVAITPRRLKRCGRTDKPIPASDQDKANARLIAAAPELLVALCECVEAYEKFRAGRETGHLWPDPNHIFHAKKAIAKARGQQ